MATSSLQAIPSQLVDLSSLEHPSAAGRLELTPAAFKIRNHLAEHPLFEHERIVRLLERMPREFIEIRAVQSASTNDGMYRRGALLTDADPVATFENLEDHPAWMLLHKSWTFDQDYEDLLHDYLAELAVCCPEMQRGIHHIGCWMFLSSGRSVVHFHSDDDQSFLNQIRGSKTVFVYPAKILPESAIDELVFRVNQGAVVYRPEYEPHLFEPIHLSPGESAFLPLFAPHRVTNDDGVSVSWNVGFHTHASRRRRKVHYVNHALRTLGFSPRGWNEHPRFDTLKIASEPAIRAFNKVRRTIRREKCVRPE